jgi:hypothetical protein
VNLAMIESGRAIARYDGRDGYGEHPRQAAYVAADEASPSPSASCPLMPVPSTPLPHATWSAPPARLHTCAAVYYRTARFLCPGAAPIQPVIQGGRRSSTGRRWSGCE